MFNFLKKKAKNIESQENPAEETVELSAAETTAAPVEPEAIEKAPVETSTIPAPAAPVPESLDSQEADIQELSEPAENDETQAKTKKPKTKKIKKSHASLKNFSFKKISRTIAFKFSFVLLLVLVFAFASLAVILTRSIEQQNDETYTTFTTSIAERTADGLSYWLDSFFKDLRVFTNSEAFKSGDYDEAMHYLVSHKNLIDANFDFMAFADADGNMKDSQGRTSYVASERFFGDIQTKGKTSFISDPVPSPDGIGYVFYISIPVTNSNNQFWGVFVGALPLGKINYEITKSNASQDSFTYAIDSTGNIIAHPDSEKIMKNFYTMGDEQSGYKGYTEMTSRMILAQTGSATIVDSERNTTNRVFFCPIYKTEWSLAVSTPESVINATARNSAYQVITICVIIAAILLLITSVYATVLVHPLTKLKNSIIEIASGDADLTKKIEVKSKDEVGDVVSGFNTFTENLRHIIRRIKESKDRLASVDKDMAVTSSETGASIKEIIGHLNNVTIKIDSQGTSVEETASKVNDIAQGIESLNKLIENQSSGVTEASAAVEQMLGNIISVTRSTEHMVDSFNELEHNTNVGISKQAEVNEQIQKIQEQSRALMEANRTISKIATETNLLAMNASIEAAHAGIAGRGFSVVADEIHVLSETSSKQSKKIREELQNIQESIEEVVMSSAEAKDSFSYVTAKIHETDQLVQQIKGAMEESEIGSHQITDALKMMNESTTDVRSSSGRMSAGNQAILDQVHNLQYATSQIKSSMDEMAHCATQIQGNGQTLTEISTTMQDSIAKIGGQIDLFKV